jgi:hypothetical protein
VTILNQNMTIAFLRYGLFRSSVSVKSNSNIFLLPFFAFPL